MSFIHTKVKFSAFIYGSDPEGLLSTHQNDRRIYADEWGEICVYLIKHAHICRTLNVMYDVELSSAET